MGAEAVAEVVGWELTGGGQEAFASTVQLAAAKAVGIVLGADHKVSMNLD